MTEERIIETREQGGTTHTHTTVVTDGAGRGGSSRWALVLIALVAAVAAVFAITQMSGAEVAKDNAVAGAAEEVGAAASQVGDAVENVAEGMTQ